MRQVADAAHIRRFMRELGPHADREARAYFTGGATAVLLGWRPATIDVDVTFVPESDPLLRAIPELKERLRINVELASPAHFLPELPGWRERSRFVAREGRVTFQHYDLYAQALAKVERGHAQDLTDVAEMVRRRLVDPTRARSLFEAIAPELYRFPAIDPATFRRAVSDAFPE